MGDSIKFHMYILGACLIAQNQLKSMNEHPNISQAQADALGKDMMFKISSKDVNTIKKYIESGANVNVKFKGTPLSWAIKLGNVDIIDALIENGAHVNIKDSDGYPLIIDTVIDANKAFAKVKALLKSKDKIIIDAQDPDGNTALMWAAYKNKPDIVKLLLNNNANIHIQNKNGIIDDQPLGKTVTEIAKNKPMVKKVLDDFKELQSEKHTKALKSATQKMARPYMEQGMQLTERGRSSAEGQQLTENIAQYLRPSRTTSPTSEIETKEAASTIPGGPSI